MTDNPYAPPKAAVLEPAAPQTGTHIPDGRRVEASRGVAWYSEAWTLFKGAPGTWILICVVFIVLSILLAIIPMGSLLSSIAYPAVAAGLMLGCRSIEEGTGLTVGHLFAGFKKNVGSLILVGVLYLVGTMLIMLFAGIGAALLIPTMISQGFNPSDLGSMMALLPFILLIALVVMALMLPLIMAIWFAPALVVFHDLAPMAAMKASFHGSLKNIVPFLLYGVVGLVLAVLAMIPVGLGMLVWIPLLWASIYTGYRDIFVKPA
jgi:uncharacterized membrane protein